MTYATESQIEATAPYVIDRPNLHIHALATLSISQAFRVAVDYGQLAVTFEPGVARQQTYTMTAAEVDALIADLTKNRALMAVAP